MAHFAKIENNTVTQVIVVSNDDCGGGEFPESEPIGQAFLASLGLEGEWKQTSYNANFRGVYASKDWTFDSATDEFRSPQPYPSWIWVNKTWQAPTPMPSTGGPYEWSEEDLEWVAI